MRSSRISFRELATLPGWPNNLQLVMDQEQSKGTEIIPVKSIILNSGELGCKYCPGAIFEERAEFRAHYQTPWHIHNQNLVLKSKKALAEEDYDEFVEITAAQSSDSDFWSEEEGEEEDDDEVNEKTLAASPLLKFKCSDHLFEIQRRIIIGDKKSNHDLQMTSELLTNFIQHSLSSTWAIFLVKSGRVFIGIYSVKQGKFTMKKSMKRYTERKKQGGSQMLRDKSGKVAKSAGSQLRRQNEVDLLHVKLMRNHQLLIIHV